MYHETKHRNSNHNISHCYYRYNHLSNSKLHNDISYLTQLQLEYNSQVKRPAKVQNILILTK